MDVFNKYFTIAQMPVSSTYGMGFTVTPDEVVLTWRIANHAQPGPTVAWRSNVLPLAKSITYTANSGAYPSHQFSG